MLGLVGAGLLGLNLVGVALGTGVFPAPPDSAAEAPLFGRTTPVLERAELERQPGEAPEAYSARVTHAVHEYMIHYWDKGGAARVPLVENFLLHLYGRLWPDRYAAYEFHSPERALERGFGLCSQQALLLDGLLRRAGIESDVIGLGGHVVASARIDADRWHLLDADYGVVVPFGLDQVEARPELLQPLYAAEGHAPENVARILEIYGPDGNRPYADREHRRAFEDRAYTLKWTIPLSCLALGALLVAASGASSRARPGGSLE